MEQCGEPGYRDGGHFSPTGEDRAVRDGSR
jgi:hypothetical protein